jgi:hypothetical protein
MSFYSFEDLENTADYFLRVERAWLSLIIIFFAVPYRTFINYFDVIQLLVFSVIISSSIYITRGKQKILFDSRG